MPGRGHSSPPLILSLPAQPDLRDGLCVGTNRPPGLSVHAWEEGASPEDAQAATETCQRCPVLKPCREWATDPETYGLPTGGIIAGLGPAMRREARRLGRYGYDADNAVQLSARRERRRRLDKRETPVHRDGDRDSG